MNKEVTLQPGQSITLGDGVTVTFLRRRRGEHVRLGITAPPSIRVFRKEVWDQMDESDKDEPRDNGGLV